MTAPRTVCQEAHELLLARQDVYGDMVDAWRRIAEAASRRAGQTVSTSTALWVLVEMKLERLRHSPEDPDHLRDAVAYLGILARVQAADEADRDALRDADRVQRWSARRAP